MLLQQAHQIGGDSDLQTVKSWSLRNLVKRL